MGKTLHEVRPHPIINFAFEIFQPVLDGYRNKCEFTIAEGPDGGRLSVR